MLHFTHIRQDLVLDESDNAINNIVKDFTRDKKVGEALSRMDVHGGGHGRPWLSQPHNLPPPPLTTTSILQTGGEGVEERQALIAQRDAAQCTDGLHWWYCG